MCAAFVGAVQLLPVRAGEITCRLLGCAVEAFDARRRGVPAGRAGRARRHRADAVDARRLLGRLRRRESCAHAYFDRYPGVWRHGDWITFTDDGACVISGRSDATLNRGGVRLGTSDFYAVVEGFPEVADSLVVHLEGDDPDDPMGELALFVALAPGARARRRPRRPPSRRHCARPVAAPRSRT